jgi:hypothetical protein
MFKIKLEFLNRSVRQFVRTLFYGTILGQTVKGVLITIFAIDSSYLKRVGFLYSGYQSFYKQEGLLFFLL